MKKRYVISGYYGFNNFGDELILSAICNKLKRENADVTVFSVSPEETAKRYGVKAAPTFNLFRVLSELVKTDVLISGGGSLFQDTTSINSLLYYSFVLFAAQILKKETIIYRQGIGPLRSPVSKFLVKNLFKRCTSVSVRDEKSLKLLTDWGIKAELAEDPVWEIEIHKAEKNDVLGVQLRKCSEISDEFLDKLASAISENKPSRIKIFALQRNTDTEICEKFKNLLVKYLPESEILIVADNLTEELSSVKKLVAMRYHALVIGIKSEVECVGINYDIKVQTLAEKYSIPLINFGDSTDIIKNKLF